MLHDIHIPVMGICYTADTPVRVAHMGLTSVISLVDDGLLEECRMAYGERLGVDVGSPQTTRIGRIRAYLDFVAEEVDRKFDWIRGLRIAGCVESGALSNSGMTGVAGCLNDKDRYFLMLPAHSPLRAEYEQVCALSGLRRVAAEVALTEKMECGEIQANIMVNLNHEEAALDAVRGFAASKVKGSLVFSAGVNLGVFEEVAKHECFYRKGSETASMADSAPTATAPVGAARVGVAPTKKIILKVSDFRSAMIQGRYLAKKGLDVYEYRIESGVNCGGHAFVGAKVPMLEVLREFMAKKEELFRATGGVPARITAQGGLCTAEEISQVLALGADGVGVGTPFLLVPQATSCDAETRALLAAATRADVRLTHASPLGVPFMNLVTSTAAEACRRKTDAYFKARIEKSKSLVAASEANVTGFATASVANENATRTETSEVDATATANGGAIGAVATFAAASGDDVTGFATATAAVANEAFASTPAAETAAMAAIRANAETVAAPADNLPGFPCRQHYLCRSIPGFNHPVCMASREYVMHRLAEIDRQEAELLDALKSAQPDAAETVPSDAVSIREKFDAIRRETLSRECICRFLGNAGREEIRAKSPSLHYDPEKIAIARGAKTARVKEPVTICPGPNIAYFNREYTLLEMMQHLYGTGPTLTSTDKPLAFDLEKEIFDTTLGA